MNIRRRKCPPLVGRGEAAEILGVHPNNLKAQRGLPEPLQDREIPGFAVGTTPLWPRAEIEEFKAKRDSARTDARAA